MTRRVGKRRSANSGPTGTVTAALTASEPRDLGPRASPLLVGPRDVLPSLRSVTFEICVPGLSLRPRVRFRRSFP
jgi:hypothetical protein